jgi:hypothetical protein
MLYYALQQDDKPALEAIARRVAARSRQVVWCSADHYFFGLDAASRRTGNSRSLPPASMLHQRRAPPLFHLATLLSRTEGAHHDGCSEL